MTESEQRIIDEFIRVEQAMRQGMMATSAAMEAMQRIFDIVATEAEEVLAIYEEHWIATFGDEIPEELWR